MTVYVVIGTKENVFQDVIGGEFLPHPDKEIVKVFSDFGDATKFVSDNKLAKGKRERYGDTSYYRNGYYDMEIESWEVELAMIPKMDTHTIWEQRCRNEFV